jgi:uncharacterized protein YbjT (DUF2867 family)
MPAEPGQRTVVVAGATGRLGALVDVLLARGHSVRAITRDPGSPAAERVRSLGAEVVYADFDDPASIRHAANGARAMFATGTAHKAGPAGEARHGRNVADAAAAAGVSHLVYSSGDGASPDSPLPLFRAKFDVEQHIRALEIPHTILAPVYFMENLFNPWNLPDLKAGRFPSPIPVHAALQQVAIADLLQFAALVIEQPDEFAGQRIPIASDELSAIEAATAISRAVARNLEAKQTQADSLGPGLRALFGWLERVGHHVDVSDLHRRYPGIRWHSYDDWASSQTSRLRGLCPRGHAHATAE